MDAILSRMPGPGALRRRAPKLAGFAFGATAMVVGAMLVTVIYTGHGFFLEPPAPPVIYPNL